jgi:hypothetical protein
MPWKAGGPGRAGGAETEVVEPKGDSSLTGGHGGAVGAGAEVVEPKGDLYIWLIPGFPPGTVSLSAGDVGEE